MGVFGFGFGFAFLIQTIKELNRYMRVLERGSKIVGKAKKSRFSL